MKNHSLRNVSLFLALSFCWAPSFLFMKIAVRELPPVVIAEMRVFIAFLVLFLFVRIKNIKFPKDLTSWKHFSIMAIFSTALPFALFPLSEKYIDSALAAIINGTTPLFTLLLAHYSTNNDRLSIQKVVGSSLGWGGLLVLVWPTLVDSEATFFGVVIGVIAAASYGAGFVYAKKYIHGFKPFVVPTAQLFIASLILFPFALLESDFSFSQISIISIMSVLGLALIGSALAFVIYYKLIALTNATYTSAVNYTLPVFGMILGAVFLNEKLSWNSYFGAAMIIIGVMIASGLVRIKNIKKNL